MLIHIKHNINIQYTSALFINLHAILAEHYQSHTTLGNYNNIRLI